MALKGPNPEDIRKLHAEINQLENERFLASTLAITFFGVAAAWQLQEIPTTAATPVGWYVLVVSYITTALLGALYWFQHKLRRCAKTLSTYLLVTGTSNWEADWEMFRRGRGYWGYSKSITGLFIVLITINSSLPAVLACAYALSWRPLVGLVLLGVFGLGAVALLFANGWLKLADPEPAMRDRWRALKAAAEGS